jgi:hypothetical protein
MRTSLIALAAAAVVAVAAGDAAAALATPRSGADTSLCVGKKPPCYPTIQTALGAAGDGERITVAPGSYAGPITIDKSVQLVGAGAGATIIEGGSPVITIGAAGAASEPIVSIAGATVTGGLSESNPLGGTAFAVGGGIEIPGAAGDATGATVSISDSVITGNRVTPRTLSLPPGLCGSRVCAFALGGGIDNFGALTLTDTRVTDNVAGSTETGSSVATEADGGGIYNHPQGILTLRHSLVSDNRAAATAANAQFSNGGGIVDDGILTLEDSVVSDNTSEVSTAVASSFPFDVEQEANAGGLWISEVPGSSATIADSKISGNSVTASNAGGDAQALNGGIDDDGSLALTSSSVDHNRVIASVPASSGFLAGAVDGGVQVQGVATVRTSRISENSLTAISATGTANAAGAGIGNLSGTLTLERSLVTGNRGVATGTGGLALGGGILNIAFGGGAPELTLADSAITANELTASAAITPRGGGLFTADIFGAGSFPVALTRTVIAGNKPDQCVGC